MPSLLCPSVPFYRNPQLRPGLAALIEFLMDRGYDCSPVRWAIYEHAATRGTLEGSPIDPEDMAAAEACFVDALEPVPSDSPAWDDPAVYLDAESLLEADAGPDGDHDAPDADPHARFPGIATLAERRGPAPMSGGSPEDLDGDRRDFEAWLERVDRPYPPADQIEEMRRWYARNPIDAFNAERTD